MKRTIAMLGLATALAMFPARAEDPPKPEEKEKPDYSKPAIMYILYEVEVKDTSIKAPDPYLISVPGFGTVGFVLSAAAGSTGNDASPMPTIDPFSLISTPAAYTPYTFRDRWAEWKAKRAVEKGK
ncbi:MAG: hypothetical protein ACSLFQ_04365 [Thermoanaerobaculia bacterium]